MLVNLLDMTTTWLLLFRHEKNRIDMFNNKQIKKFIYLGKQLRIDKEACITKERDINITNELMQRGTITSISLCTLEYPEKTLYRLNSYPLLIYLKLMNKLNTRGPWYIELPGWRTLYEISLFSKVDNMRFMRCLTMRTSPQNSLGCIWSMCASNFNNMLVLMIDHSIFCGARGHDGWQKRSNDNCCLKLLLIYSLALSSWRMWIICQIDFVFFLQYNWNIVNSYMFLTK